MNELTDGTRALLAERYGPNVPRPHSLIDITLTVHCTTAINDLIRAMQGLGRIITPRPTYEPLTPATHALLSELYHRRDASTQEVSL